MKKYFLIFTTLFIISGLFAQEVEDNIASEEAPVTSQTETVAASENESFLNKLKNSSADFVLQFEPGLYLNTASTLVSAPSPIIYPISVGFLWPDNTIFSVQPSLSFFMMHHLFYDNKALPAEIENRTTTTLSFMLNIPFVFSIFRPNSRFQISGGLGILMRFGLLSPGVRDSDSGWTGSAGSDTQAINGWFWQNARWLYVTVGGSWLYNLTPQLKAGPTINVYIPVGGLFSDGSAQAMIISAGIKICR